ncbi:MAG: major capsid protein [Pseudonocardia sp.]|nr:major capsid protein [Pseudonocardia sp.]
MAYDDVLANLSEVDDDRLGTAHGEITARINELRPKAKDRTLTPEELTELQELSETFKQVNGESGRRGEQRDQAYAAIDEAVSLIPDGEQAEQAEEPAAEAEDTPEPETAEDTTQNERQEQPVAASASNPPIGSIGRQTPEQRQTVQPTVGITAAADVAGFSAGGTVTPERVGEAFANRMRSLAAIKGRGGNGEMVPVVTLTASGVPEERKLARNDWALNTRRMEAVTSPRAITAAGGLCAPLAIDYSYGTIGVQDRPIRDSLPGFQAERGGIQYRRDLSPVTNTASDGPKSASGNWTNANDAAVEDPDVTTPRKAVWVVDCPDTETAEVEALTLQLEFSNVTSRFDPETLQANTDAAMIWHSRFAENWLLEKLQAESKVMTSTQVLGAVRDLLYTFDRVQAYYRSVHRLSANIPLRAIMPSWAVHLLRADMARAMQTSNLDQLAIPDARINGWFAARNINPVWHLDGSATDQAETAYAAGPPIVPFEPAIEAQQYVLATDGPEEVTVPDFPTEIDFLLHTEGHFTHLEGGTLDLGIVRDADLIDRNRYRQFSETWEGVATRGVEALRVVAKVLPTGASSGTEDLTPVAP